MKKPKPPLFPKRSTVAAESAVDDMLSATPPSEIGDGHILPDQEKTARRIAQRFGSLVAVREGTQARQDRGPRPGGSAPDKRTGLEPAPCEIPARAGGNVRLW